MNKPKVSILAPSFNHQRFIGKFIESVLAQKFSKWIEQNAREWELYKFIPNRYPFDEANPNHTSFADFYFYKKRA